MVSVVSVVPTSLSEPAFVANSNAASEIRLKHSGSARSLAYVQQKREEQERWESQQRLSCPRTYRLSSEIARERQMSRGVSKVPMSLSPTATVATDFVWPYPGEQVSVCGSFCGWRDKMPLRFEDGVWKTTLHLFPGTYQFKFLVNGTMWCFDVARPVNTDDEGNTNNIVRVEKPHPVAHSFSSAW